METPTQIKLAQGQLQKKSLISKLQSLIAQLQEETKQQWDDAKVTERNQLKIERLKERIGLIRSCNEYSLLRLNHLQQIFKHYCIHVFRTGKHMTFDRLEYEKAHMTLERFFLFIRDFQLTTAIIDNKRREIVQKNYIITIFKKISSNCSHLSFQQFVQCLEKLGVVYWNQKQNFKKKQKQSQRHRQKRRRLLQRRNLKKQGLLQQLDENKQPQQQNNRQQQKIMNEQDELNNDSRTNKLINKSNENDGMIDDLINNQDIEDPNEEVNSIVNIAKQQNQIVNQNLKAKQLIEQSLLTFSVDQKIQNYYKMLGIDSFDNYKHKLTSLNLPTFQLNQHHTAFKDNKVMSQSKLEAIQAEEDRLKKLKDKLNQKKQKLKQKPLPKPSNERAMKEQQNSQRRRQLKKERQNAVKQIKTIEVQKKEPKQKIIPPAKVQYKESEISWDVIQKLNIQQLKLKQFNPTKFYSAHEDDTYFLQEYGSKPRMSSRLQARERQSLSIVESTKMRAEQLLKKQMQMGALGTIKRRKKNVSGSKF